MAEYGKADRIQFGSVGVRRVLVGFFDISHNFAGSPDAQTVGVDHSRDEDAIVREE